MLKIKGLRDLIERYILENKLAVTEFYEQIGLKKATYHRMMKFETVSSAETFVSLLKLFKGELWVLIEPTEKEDRVALLEEPRAEYARLSQESALLAEILTELRKLTGN